MSIELHSQGIARYAPLASNPIYYFHAIQYTNGDFYRAILGYENVWDKDYETALVKSLDYILHYHDKRHEYYFEELVFNTETFLYGIPWRRGIKPALDFRATASRRMERGSRAFARINLLDNPHHVDIEFEDGSVMTVAYLRYLIWKKKHIRSLNENSSSRSKQNGPSSKNGQRGKAGEAESVSSFIASGTLPDNVLDMRKRFGRAKSLREAYKKISRRLV